MRRSLVLSVLITACVAQSNVMAQNSEQQQFRLPAVGTTIPDIAVYDEDGNAFSTKDLRGQYTVLVFGCLT